MRFFAAIALAVLMVQPYPLPFPREGVAKVLENDRVVVWEVKWAKGRPTAMHEHRLDLVGVVVEGGQAKITLPDGTVRQGEATRAGAAAFQPKGVVHVEESLVDAGRNVVIELKDGQPVQRPLASALPNAFPREGATLLFENSRVSVWDYRWAVGRPVPAHFHGHDVVSVTIEPGELRFTTPTGQTRTSRQVPGGSIFIPRGDAHREEATSGAPRAVIVELK